MTRRHVQPARILDRRALLETGAAGAIGLLFVGPARRSRADDENAKQPKLRDGKQLDVLSAEPLNAEPDHAKLIASWITPVEQFYVRTHGITPEVDEKSFKLSIEGQVEKPQSFTLAELRESLPQQTITATMTCAGNRRTEHSRIKEVAGVQWGSGAIGNARWRGLRLADLLKKAGVREGAKHVWFESVDKIAHGDGTIPFGGSIPLDKAMAGGQKQLPVLLAHTMNGRPLPLDHGFPLRAVVPGYIGARSVKWLGRLVVSDRPSDNHYVAQAYKIVTEGTEAELAAAEPVLEFPINSVICRPSDGAKVKPGKLTVRGYALPPGEPGRKIERVELSADGGKTWHAAEITSQNRPECWCLWRAEVPVTAATKSLLVRATDSAGDMQPQKVEWNMKGYLYNAWHSVKLDVTG